MGQKLVMTGPGMVWGVILCAKGQILLLAVQAVTRQVLQFVNRFAGMDSFISLKLVMTEIYLYNKKDVILYALMFFLGGIAPLDQILKQALVTSYVGMDL